MSPSATPGAARLLPQQSKPVTAGKLMAKSVDYRQLGPLHFASRFPKYLWPGSRDLSPYDCRLQFGSDQLPGEPACHADRRVGRELAYHLVTSKQPQLQRNGGWLESGSAERLREQLRRRHARVSDNFDHLRQRKRLAFCADSGQLGTLYIEQPGDYRKPCRRNIHRYG